MSKAYIKGRPYPVPSKWAELRPAQVLQVVRLLFLRTLTVEQAQLQLLFVLLRIAWRPRLVWQLLTLPAEDVHTLTRLTHFLLDAKISLTAQLFPRVRRHWTQAWLYGPLARLQGLTFAEWIDAEAAYFKWRQKKQPDALNQLVAILYRPRRRGHVDVATDNGDVREAYNQHHVDARAQLVATWPEEQRLAIMLFYDSCRADLVKRFADVFPEPEPGAAPAPPTNPTLAYYRILREMAGSPDRYDVIGRQLLSNVFFDLSERIQEAERIREELDERRATHG